MSILYILKYCLGSSSLCSDLRQKARSEAVQVHFDRIIYSESFLVLLKKLLFSKFENGQKQFASLLLYYLLGKWNNT